MKIPQRDVTYIVLSVYLLMLIDRYALNRKSGTSPISLKIYHTQVNLIQLKTFDLN